MTNRKLHMRFQLSPRSISIQQVRIFSEFCVISQMWEATTAKRMTCTVSDRIVTHWVYFSAMHRLRWYCWAFPTRVYNQNTVGENGDFQPLHTKISRKL